jgi:hypothetical protein
VRTLVAALDPGVTVQGCLCIATPAGIRAESGLPLLRTLHVRGYALLQPRRLARRLNARGPFGRARMSALHAALEARLAGS